ncbi:glycosyltransferase [Halobacteriovorax sp. HLS]|uniref:glycosyltransferase n=1 Tax=Halobacteriovorax sp. HLS TaxID=2234000 RepID=UPI000FDC7F61|nr:glycosyltransferase [Halobacteriovorax sp. HLS]
MKVKRGSIHRDPCLKSINSLYTRVENFFSKNPQFKSNKRFYVDHYSSVEFDLSADEVVDVIFFGDCVKKFFESGNWNFSSCRFWVLSMANKRILENFLGIEDIVNVVPRDEIFNIGESKQIDWEEELDLVFAGRLSAQKNITLILSVLNSLNKNGVKCSLHLFGSYDDTYHEDYGRRENKEYETKVLKQIENLKLSQSVTFYGELAEDQWLNTKFSNPVYISLSSYICEDFGCSVAQSQQKGWPLIISDWGGHKDIFGKGIYKIPSSLISHSHLPKEITSLMGDKIARYLLECDQMRHLKPKYEIDITNSISLDFIDKARRKTIKALGGSALLLNREFLSHFSDTVKGTIFLDKIRSFMSSNIKNISVISFDFDTYEESFSDSFLKTLRNMEMNDVNVFYISSKNIFDKDSLKRILSSERVVLNKFKESDKIYSYLIDKVKIDVSCIYYE